MVAHPRHEEGEGVAMKKIRLVVADDHRLFREGLHKLLSMEPDMEVVGEAADGVEALRVVRELVPDLLIFDVNLSRTNIIHLIRELRSQRDLRFVAITSYGDETHLGALSLAGVHGCLLKAAGLVELLSAVRAVFRGDPYVDQRLAGKLLPSFPHRQERKDALLGLTAKEKETLFWISQGFSNATIAEKMVVSEKTVKNHVSHVLKKLDLRDRTQAAVLAWRLGLAQLAPEVLGMR